jgi:hypothetical protein
VLAFVHKARGKISSSRNSFLIFLIDPFFGILNLTEFLHYYKPPVIIPAYPGWGLLWRPAG